MTYRLRQGGAAVRALGFFLRITSGLDVAEVVDQDAQGQFIEFGQGLRLAALRRSEERREAAEGKQ